MSRGVIGLLSPLFRSGPGSHGGITSVVTHLTDGFLDTDMEVDVIVYAPPESEHLIRERHPRAAVVNLGRGRKPAQAWSLARYAWHRRPQAILAAGQRSNALLALAGPFMPRGVQRWASVHNTLSQGLGEQPAVSRGLQRWWVRRVLQAADGIIAVSAGVRDDLTGRFGLPGDRVHVVHNPVPRCRGAYPVPHPWLAGPVPVVLAVGRLVRQKDFATFIDAIAILHQTMDVRAIILGEGPLRPSLESQVRSRGLAAAISLPGFVAEPVPWMSHANLLALTSRWEGFGNVLVEAMACGTPVVATDCPSGPREILQDGRFGPLVAPGDVPGLARAIGAVLRNPPPRQEMLRGAAPFSPEVICGEYLRLLFGDGGVGP